jgi:NADH-quinone oxidoreductase subunit J
MDISTVIFYVLTLVIITGAAAVLLLPNPIYSALSLAVTMIGLGFMYMQLEAYFIASVQLIVYAGAVMVLFVMVLMLFDLESEQELMSRGAMSKFLKIICGVIFTGIISWAIKISVFALPKATPLQSTEDQMANVKRLAIKLFTQYLFAFELLGILLLVIAIGVVAISRTRGGTHARD